MNSVNVGWKSILLNFIWFQTIWFCVVLFQNQFVWLAILLIFGYVAILPFRYVNMLFGVAMAFYGTLVDGTMAAWGFYEFTPRGRFLLPIWLVVLWVAFGFMLRVSLTYLRRRYLLASILGAVFGPLSYFAAAKLGAVSFPQSLVVTGLMIGAWWAITVPLWLRIDLWLSTRIEQVRVK